MTTCRHSPQSAIRVRAGSFSFCILRNNCGPAYGRDLTDRPARPCGFGRISQNLFGPLIAAVSKWCFAAEMEQFNRLYGPDPDPEFDGYHPAPADLMDGQGPL